MTEEMLSKPDLYADLCNEGGDEGPVRQRKGWNVYSVLRALLLLTDEFSVWMSDRVIRSIEDLLAEFPRGFLIRALSPLFGVIEQLLQQSRHHDAYIDLLSRVVTALGLPLWKERETMPEDEWSQVVETGNLLGYLLRECPHPRVRLEVCQVLGVMIPGRPDRLCTDEFRFKALNQDEYLRAIEESSIGTSLMETMRAVEEEGLYIELLKVLLALCYRSERNCCNMVESALPHVIAQRMLWTDDVLFLTTEILIQMAVNGPAEAMLEQLTCRACIGTLRMALQHQLKCVQSVVNRQLRNDILTLAVFVTRQCPPVPLVETGLASDLLHLAAYTELKPENCPFNYLQPVTSKEDFELKKLLITLPALMLKTSVTVSMVTEHQVMLSLLMIISRDLRPAFNYKSAVMWSEPQFRELQLLALQAVAAIIGSLPQDALTFRASTRLLLYLDNYLNDDPLITVEHLQACLLALHNAAASGEPELLSDLADQDTITTLTKFLRHPRMEELADSPQCMSYVSLVSECLAILSCLCDMDQHRKSLFGKEGVHALLWTLQKATCKNCHLGPKYYTVIINAMGAVWSCISGCPNNEAEFMLRGGIDLMLDLLDAPVPVLLKLSTLGCLLRLCDTCAAAASFILRWRSKTGRTCVQLLLALWREEEKELGCGRDEDGIITDLDQPLRGATQKLDPFNDKKEPVAVLEMVAKTRPKIFGIIEHLKEVNMENGQFVPELTDIDVRDQVTLALVENYLDLKEGEVCQEVRAQIEDMGFEPIHSDQIMLNDMQVVEREKSRYTQSLQTDLQAAAHRRDVADERRYFDRQKQLEMQELLVVRRVSEHIARTSCPRVLAQSKRRQLQEVADTTCTRLTGRYFRTMQLNTNVTVFCSRNVDIAPSPRDDEFSQELELERKPDTSSGSLRSRITTNDPTQRSSNNP